MIVHSSPLIIRKFPIVVAPFESGFEDLGRHFKPNSVLIGYFQSPKYWNTGMQDKLRQIIRLQETSPELESLREISSIEWPLVVHVRLGDYNDFSEFGILSSDYYKKSIDFLWKTGNYKKIWIFTNSPNKVLSYLPWEYRENFRLIDICGGSAAHNLEAMRLGYGYIISNSTYSWWGAYLSNNFDSVVVAPDVWFKTLPEPESLLPESWIRMKASHE